MVLEVIEGTPSNPFADAIRRARLDKRVPLRDLARRLDVSVPYVSDMERGRRYPPPSDQMVRTMAECLGLDADALLRLAWSNRPHSGPDVATLMEQLAAANADRARLREMLRSLHAIVENFAVAVPLVIGPSVQKLRDTVREAGELLADVPATRVRRIDPP